MSLNGYAVRCATWVRLRFPDDTLELRGLILAEETGEVVRCIAKMQTGMRGSREEWMRELYVEVGDVFLALQALCNHAGIDLDAAVADRWRQVEHVDVFTRRMPA